MQNKNSEISFETIRETFLKEQGVAEKKMFGTVALTINGKVFAFLFKGKLVLKLPREQVAEIIVAKKGNPFGHMYAPDKWRPMKDWVEVKPTRQKEWLKLAKEAKDFVLSIKK